MKPVVLRRGLALCLLALLSACGGKLALLSPAPTVAQLNLVADAGVNPDTKGRPTPVVVRYYALANAAAFESADFFSLFDAEDKTLGASLLAREELTVRPGQSVASTLKPQGEAKALGVLVAFRDVNKALWRATAALPANKTSTFRVTLGKDRVSLELAK